MSRTQSAEFTEFSFGRQVPAHAHSVTLSIRITPRTGSVLICGAPREDALIMRCTGPIQQTVIGYGTGIIFIKKEPGTTDFQIAVLGWG